jgi:hypothetical protein
MLPEIAKLLATKPEELAKEILADKTSSEKLATIPFASMGHMTISAMVENIPLAEEHARFFSDPVFKTLRVSKLPDLRVVRIEWEGHRYDLNVGDGSLLDEFGVRDQLAYAMDPAVEQFVQLRLNDLMIRNHQVSLRLPPIALSGGLLCWNFK